jgi:hypothetical protein
LQGKDIFALGFKPLAFSCILYWLAAVFCIGLQLIAYSLQLYFVFALGFKPLAFCCILYWLTA